MRRRSASRHAEEAKPLPEPSPEPSPPRATEGVCMRCEGAVASFFNHFLSVADTNFYLPALLGSWSSRLRPTAGRPKQAPPGTELDGCLVQSLACPNCSEVLGLRVVDVPAGKSALRGRDFFNLSRIKLQCEVAPGKVQVVEPFVGSFVDTTQELPSSDHSDRPSPAPADMEVDTRPQLPRPEQQLRDHHHFTPLRQVEANRQPLPPPIRSPPAPLPSHGPSPKSTTNLPMSSSPAGRPVHDVQFSQPPSREGTAGLANRTRDLPPVTFPPSDQHRTNDQHHPRSPPDVSVDAIGRLQTQISQNSSALAVQNRDIQVLRDDAARQQGSLHQNFQTMLHQQRNDIRRIDEVVGNLQYEMGGLRDRFDALHRDVQSVLGTRSMPPVMSGSIAAQESAMEMMSNQITNVAQKTNEIDALKITVEFMRARIERLEKGGVAPAPQPPSHPSHNAPPHYTTPTTAPVVSTPVHPAHRPNSFQGRSNHRTPAAEDPERTEAAQPPSGWVTVNANAKRAHQLVIDGSHDSPGQPVGSPKRPKLAPIEPRAAYPSSQVHPHPHVYDHMDTDDSESRIQTHSHTLPSQPHPEALVDMTISQPSLASQNMQHSGYLPYNTQDGPSDDSWRPESQRVVEHRTPRGRGRGGGPGSRGGRGRKSLPSQIQLGTPEWEREDWRGAPESQTSPDGYYNHAARANRGITRRGSGGSTRGRPSSSNGRAVSLGMQGVTTGAGVDPYAHTKKTRTKPIRNADGVLIRKDGRPDMRSQSSAANLRKVHARKEEQKGSDRGFTPTSSLRHGTSIGGAETPSPTGFLPTGQDITDSVQRKHNSIMGKMFPSGVDESRNELDYARKVFEPGQDHTAQPRGQHHHHGHHQQHLSEQRALQIKQEHSEDRAVNSQSPDEEDVDMDRAEHADDEGQSPSDRSEDFTPEEERAVEAAPETNGGQRITQSTLDTSSTTEAAPPAASP